MHTFLVIAAWLGIGLILALTYVVAWRIKGTAPPSSEALPFVAGIIILWPLIAAVICFFLLFFWDLIFCDMPPESDILPTR